MRKYIYKYSYYIICMLFVIALVLVVAIRKYIVDEIGLMLINYGFWYCFGLFSGFSIAVYVFKKQKTTQRH
jgi:hypothetical protein